MKIVKHTRDLTKKDLDTLLNRADSDLAQAESIVRNILQDIQQNGDSALMTYTKKFDCSFPRPLKVAAETLKEALEACDPELIATITEAADNIRSFHQEQVEETWWTEPRPGVKLGQKITPLDRVGLYIPGGKAAYPSTVLMTAIPAQVAGVQEIALVSPPQNNGEIHPIILATAAILGIDEVYRVGGAQSIAALAYGTETIKNVDKIVGPGNLYVALAKKEVFGRVDIDMIAGPSEIAIIADETANPIFVAADLLSQAEHDERAASILITTSQALAKSVQAEIEIQLNQLDRQTIIKASLENYGTIFLTSTLEEAVDISNMLAPEHLELQMKDPMKWVPKIRHAGAIFIGPYTPEPIGDYFAGPNHTLPTSGTARFASPLGTYDYCKRSSLVFYDQTALSAVSKRVAAFAREEGLDAHAYAIERRVES
ncbi:histidinol dehydrogenase [Gottschalkiaceae bacterium SANA]|nr:histidinol dehydrogenase [Gottschalkiaceae bacterium SANA]